MSTKSLVRNVIMDAVSATVARPDVPAKPDAVGPIVEAVSREVAPLVANATNSEPWYQSRVTIGALVSIIIPLLGFLGISSDVIDPDQLTALIMAGGALFGGLFSLYGRWKAKRPIGQ